MTHQHKSNVNGTSGQTANYGNSKAASLPTEDQVCLRPGQSVASIELNLAAPVNSLEWYVLTEITSSLLNELIAYTSRERRRLMKQVEPDLCKVKLLEEQFKEIHGINSDPENFKSLGRMKAIIERYAPKLTAVTDA